MTIIRPHQPFGEMGGEEYDDVKFREGQLRADLCVIANNIDQRSGAKIVDAIMAEYTLTAKFGKFHQHPRKKEKQES